MKEKLVNSRLGGIIKHPLFSGSAIMIIGSNGANFIAYLYHLIIGRMLGPSSYSELATVISVITMFTVTFTFFSMVIVKFVSAADGREVKTLFSWFSRRGLVLALFMAILALLLSPVISKFLHIDQKIILLLSPILFVSVFGMVFRSFLQGLMKFEKVAILANIDMLGRLSLGVFFIYLGFSVFGAILGLLMAASIALFMARKFLSKYSIFATEDKFSDGKKIAKFALPIFFSSFASNSFYSTDLILVKHFFNAHDAGIYASLSNLGKIIFFGAAPVSAVMFPMISKRHAKGHRYRKIFFLSFIMVSAIAGSVLLVYLFFPELAVGVLYGDKYLDAADNLFLFGGFMSIFTLASLIVSFYLSQHKTKVVIFVVIFALLQALGIWFFHDTIVRVISVSIASVSLLLGSLLIYFGYESKKGKASVQ